MTRGQEQIAALGLTNVTLVHADLLDASDLGTFDYVVAHGLYSWVPPAVQERVLAIASEVLAPNGVAYVSYNALPGCHVRNAMRQMMRWHVRDIEDPAERIAQARGLVRFLGEAAPPRPLFSAILKDTLDHQEKQPDAVLFHDDLAEINEPLLFVDFIERAGRHRLKFLSEADYCDMAVWNADSPAGRFLIEVGAENVVLQQQYRDFLIFRRFRQTLLCRDDASLVARARSRGPSIALRRRGDPAGNSGPRHRIGRAGALRSREGRRGDDAASSFEGRVSRARCDLAALGRGFPSSSPPPGRASRRPEAALATAEDESRLLRFLLGSYGANVTQLRSTACPFVTEISERPRASALARLQARTLGEVTNLKHDSVRLEDPLVRTFLELLDGTRDRMTIASEMATALRGMDPAAAALAADIKREIALNFDRVSGLALLEG